MDGSSECDLLQALWDGYPELTIYQGWRDNINDKAALFMIYLAEGIGLHNFCEGQSN